MTDKDLRNLSLEERATWALDLAVRYGRIDGGPS